MSIDRAASLKSVATVQTRDNTESTNTKTRAASSTAAPVAASQVSLSGAQLKLSSDSSQDINMARVEELKTAIRNGDLKMDAGKIADALIADTKSWLENS